MQAYALSIAQALLLCDNPGSNAMVQKAAAEFVMKTVIGDNNNVTSDSQTWQILQNPVGIVLGQLRTLLTTEAGINGKAAQLLKLHTGWQHGVEFEQSLP